MQVLSRIGAVVLIAVVGTGAVAALHPHNNAHVLTVSKGPAALVFTGSYEIDPISDHHLARPSAEPLLIPTPASTPGPPPQAAPAAPARPAPSVVIGSTQQALINQDRAAAGLGPLSWSNCLYSVAASNAGRLSQQGWVPPYHTNGPSVDLGCRLGQQAGENVGYWRAGINDSGLNSMFMSSPEHHANIMGPYHYVATAWVVAPNGNAYIAVEFS